MKTFRELREKDLTAVSSWKRKLRNVKGLTKDQLQMLSQMPTPVVTAVINQVGMIVAQKEGKIRVVSARTEDDTKPSLAGAIGTRRARSEIRKRIKDMTIRTSLFENYSARIEPFVIEYDRRVRAILQQYVDSGVLEEFETNINSRNMTAEDIQNGIFRGSVKLRFAGRDDIYGSESDDELVLDDIIGTFERLVN